MSEFKKIVGVVIKYKNEVLLCKRNKKKSLPNEWSIPSGHMENEETPLDGAIREFKEETDINIDKKKLNLVGILSGYDSERKIKNKIFFVYSYNTDKKILPDLDNAKDGHEHTECKYFTKNELPKSKKTESMMKIIKKI
jgi:ADP-ribose pyrophosphatase YjhB (NUDIX family)